MGFFLIFFWPLVVSYFQLIEIQLSLVLLVLNFSLNLFNFRAYLLDNVGLSWTMVLWLLDMAQKMVKIIG